MAPASVRYVKELDSEFLGLWPNRYDYILAPHSDPDKKPEWQTETRHPLSDRLIQQGAYLYGVRPGAESAYCLLDIDAGSPYHPKADKFAVGRICAALESLGLVRYLVLTSSYSGGLHIYLPFDSPVASWKLGIAASALLENAGFKLIGGWLEVFPNRKPYSAEQTLFNAHRLPLQAGSYLLNESFEATAAGQTAFATKWHLTAAGNVLDEGLLDEVVKAAVRKNYYVSGKAEKFLNDLNADIEIGWTGKGQTNFLLGKIAARSYIFGHVLGAPEPLEGEALIESIVAVATSLPNYSEFCGHQHEIEQRAREWATCVEKEHRYFHYGSKASAKAADSDEPTWNAKQAASARDRIRETVAELMKGDGLPDGITTRYKALCETGIGGNTLYKNRDLWHPAFIRQQQQASEENSVQIPPNPPSLCEEVERDACEGSTLTTSLTSLLGAIGDNSLETKGSSLDKPDDSHREAENKFVPPPKQLSLLIKESLTKAKKQAEKRRERNFEASMTDQQQATRAAHLKRLNDWLISGDPLLIAEAEKQLRQIEDGESASHRD